MRKLASAILVLALCATVQVWSIDYPSLAGHPLGLPLGFDTLRNTSRLTDQELRDGFERFLEWQMERTLDCDKNGIADFTGIPVEEFLGRMKIILSDREPFEYVYSDGSPSMRDGWVFYSQDERRFDL